MWTQDYFSAFLKGRIPLF